jgi:hypothetical protein
VKRRVLLLAAIVALIAGGAFFGGYWVGARPAASASQGYTLRVRDMVTVPHPAARAAYTLRYGDVVTVPAVNQVCTASSTRGVDSNAGPFHPDFYCAPLPPRPVHHEVFFFRDSIRVAGTGNTDHPVRSGKP